MIKIWNTETPEAVTKAFINIQQDSFLCRILCLYHSYGANAKFADFWYQQNEAGTIVGVLSRVDGQMVLYTTEQAEMNEICLFIQAVGASSVLCNKDCKLSLRGKTVTTGKVLTCKPPLPYTGRTVDKQPDLKQVYKLLKNTFRNSFYPDYESFYLDLSHKIRHGTARCYSIVANRHLAAAALTVAETDRAAVIGSVAVDHDYRRQGLGVAVLSAVAGDLSRENKQVFLYTEENSPATVFYHKAGWTPRGGWSQYII